MHGHTQEEVGATHPKQLLKAEDILAHRLDETVLSLRHKIIQVLLFIL